MRSYRDKPVEPDKLERILEAVRLAPSGSNRQPWKFVIVRDAATRAKLAAACRNQKFIGFRDNTAFVGVLSTQLWHREFVQGATVASDIPYAVA